MDLSHRALLVSLCITQWVPWKFDKTATNDVDSLHQAKESGRFNKRLIPTAEFSDINSAQNKARSYFNLHTQPWGDDGQRLIAATRVMTFSNEIQALRMEYMRAVDKFMAKYPQLQQDARVRPGSLYNPNEFPPEALVQAKFTFAMETFAAPSSDFRSDIPDEVKANIISSVNKRQEDAVKSCIVRVRDQLERIARVCGSQKSAVRDSLMDSTTAMVDILGDLNITDDPEIERLRGELRQIVVPTDTLRRSKHARAQTADRADEILASMAGLV